MRRWLLVFALFSSPVFSGQQDAWESTGCREIVDVQTLFTPFALYTVKPGDTLSGIVQLMRKCGVNSRATAESIRVASEKKNIQVEKLHPGQRVCIPLY